MFDIMIALFEKNLLVMLSLKLSLGDIHRFGCFVYSYSYSLIFIIIVNFVIRLLDKLMLIFIVDWYFDNCFAIFISIVLIIKFFIINNYSILSLLLKVNWDDETTLLIVNSILYFILLVIKYQEIYWNII